MLGVPAVTLETYDVTVQIDRAVMERVEQVANAMQVKRSVLLGILISDGLDANAVALMLADLPAKSSTS